MLRDPLRSPLQPVLRRPTDVSGGGVPVDPDVTDYLARLALAGGTIGDTALNAYKTLVASARASGYYTKILRWNLFIGANLTSALVPQKVGGGNATDTNVNFVGGDYTESTGLTGNASNKYLRTGIIPSTMLSTNDTHLALYNRSSGTSGLHLAGLNSGSQALVLYAPFQGGTTGTSDQYNATGGQGRITGALGTPFGFAIGSRTAANAHTLYRNGSSVATAATSGGTLPSVELYVFARNNNGAVDNYGAAAAGAYSIGSGLSAADVTAYTTHMETFQDALSRGVA